jgi:hypothetical protein
MASRARGSSKSKVGANAKPTNRMGEPKKSPRVNGLNKKQLRQLRATERAAGKRKAS